MFSFDGAVVSCIVRRTKFNFNVEGFEEVLEEVGQEGIAVVGEGCGWEAVPGHPAFHEGLGDLFGRVPGQRETFQPSGASVKAG